MKENETKSDNEFSRSKPVSPSLDVETKRTETEFALYFYRQSLNRIANEINSLEEELSNADLHGLFIYVLSKNFENEATYACMVFSEGSLNYNIYINLNEILLNQGHYPLLKSTVKLNKIPSQLLFNISKELSYFRQAILNISRKSKGQNVVIFFSPNLV